MALAIFSEEQRKWWTLAAVSFGLFMIMLDNTVVNVALPSIQEDLGATLSQLPRLRRGNALGNAALPRIQGGLGATLSQLQWIVTGYALTFAALMLIGGKLADAYGRRLVFLPRPGPVPPRPPACGGRR